MGSKVSIVKPRLKKYEFEALCASIDKEDFLQYYLVNGNEAVCEHYNIGLGPMYRLLKVFNIQLTQEQLKLRNQIAAEQRVFALYGVSNNFQRPEIQLKAAQTNINKYGVPNVFSTETVKNKIKQTCLNKYGVEYHAQCSAIHSKAQKKYQYDQINFDSLPELALWIYAKDHNIPILREPLRLAYIYDTKQHYYFPDFLYNGQLVEIKGKQFFRDKDKTKFMINPYDSTKNDLAEAKHQCGLRNGVQFWTEDEYNFATDYLNKTYKITLNKIPNKKICIVELSKLGD